MKRYTVIGGKYQNDVPSTRPGDLQVLGHVDNEEEFRSLIKNNWDRAAGIWLCLDMTTGERAKFDQ